MVNNLLKIMVVDDEQFVRELFKMCVDWEELGMEIAGEAASGQEALEVIEKISPDILFTDICMPFMDGMELSRIVAEKYFGIKTVVLTAYDEFEYAKKGIKVGISDFLLKPINGEEIRKTALNMKKRIEAERNHQDEYLRLKRQLEENLPYLKEKLLNELVLGSANINDLNAKLEYFSITWQYQTIQVAVIEGAHPEIPETEGTESEMLLGIHCFEIVQQYFRDDCGVEIFFDNSRRIVVVSGNENINLFECCEQLKSMVMNKVKCLVSIGLGNRYLRLRDINKSYKEACDALNYRIHTGWNYVISFSDLSVSEKNLSLHDNEFDGIGTCIKSGLENEALKIIEDIYSEVKDNKIATIEYIRVLSANIISAILNAVTELGVDYKEIFQEEVPYNNIFKIDNLPDMKRFILKITVSTITKIKGMRSRKTSKFINDIILYLEKNLANSELSLVSTAKEFYINPSYLSRVFKQETGSSFVEYITKIRMERALTLMKETDLKAYQIAENVGIQDPNYFSICFKKFTGMSLNDFRKQM